MGKRIKKKRLIILALLALVLCGLAGCSRADSTELNSPQTTIAVEAGTIMETAARNAYPDAHFVYVDSLSDGLLAVTSGEVDAYASEKTGFEKALRAGTEGVMEHPDGTLSILGEIAVGISPKAEIPDAQELIDTFLSEIEEDGTLADIEKRWIEEDDYTMPELEPVTDPSYTIRIGTSGLSEPFSFYDDGESLAGVDIEIAMRFAQWCNAALEFEVYDWDGLISACVSGKVDYIIGDLIATDERRDVIDFSDYYRTDETVMVIPDSPTGITAIAQKDEGGFWQRLASSFKKTFVEESRWKLILHGLGVTIVIVVLSAVFGTILGFLLYLLLQVKNRVIATIASVFCRVIEGIPTLVILMIIYFLIFASTQVSPVLVGAIAFSIVFMVTVADDLEAGTKAVPAGQAEAASALGFSRVEGFFHVVFPQAVRHVMPVYKGELIGLLEVTSVVGYISIEDLTKVGDIIRSRTYEAFFPLITTAVIYLILAIVINVVAIRIERRIDPFQRKRSLPKGVTECTVSETKAAPAAAREEGELINIRHLKKSYPNVTPLRDVNAEVNRGDIVTVIGPSGTGKSTMLRCINRMETPTEGSILVFGENVCDKKTDLNLIRRRMGMVFQSFNLFGHLTVVENLMLAPTQLKDQPKQEAYENAMRLLKMVGLAEQALSYPEELSGGQMQRVAIARALAMDPEIVLFDEPTSSLDPAVVGEVLSVIRRLAAQGLTMMIVTHEMQFARDVSTRVFFMEEGVIYEEGTPEEIFDAPKRDKTRVFVRQLRTLELKVDSPDYDFIETNEALRMFGEKHLLVPRRINSLCRAFEELAAENIIPHCGEEVDLTVSVEYEERGDELIMRFVWPGEAYNPLEEGDELSVMLIKAFLTSDTYTYEEGRNRLEVVL